MTKRADDETPALRAVADARKALTAAENAVVEKREALAVLMVKAAGEEGAVIARIARYADYREAYVRRTLRLRGVAPKQPKRIPPPGFRRAPVDAE